MAGLKKSVACLVCCLVASVGAGVGAYFLLNGADKSLEEENKIVREFLNSPELASNVSGEVLEVLKQEKDKSTICTLMKNISPETYTLYCNVSERSNNLGKAAAFTTVGTVLTSAGAIKYAIDINNERRKQKREMRKVEEKLYEMAGNIELDKGRMDRVWARIEEGQKTEQEKNKLSSQKVEQYCNKVDTVCDMIYETFGVTPESSKNNDDEKINTK